MKDQHSRRKPIIHTAVKIIPRATVEHTTTYPNPDFMSSNSGELDNDQGMKKKTTVYDRRKLALECNQEMKKRKCLPAYYYPCCLLCICLCALVMLLIAAALAAVIITFTKPKPSATAETSTTISIVTLTTNTNTTNAATSSGTATSISIATTTTTARSFCRITRAGDPIRGLFNTTAGASTGGFEGRYSPFGETPDKILDNNTVTKYLNYGTNGSMYLITPQPGVGTGFYVTPTISSATVANGILFATGSDYPNRDPLTMTLEGTNSTALNVSSSWTLLYNGSTGIDATIAPNRSTYSIVQAFANIIAYRSYRVLITSQRAADDSVQYSEAHIMAYC